MQPCILRICFYAKLSIWYFFQLGYTALKSHGAVLKVKAMNNTGQDTPCQKGKASMQTYPSFIPALYHPAHSYRLLSCVNYVPRFVLFYYCFLHAYAVNLPYELNHRNPHSCHFFSFIWHQPPMHSYFYVRKYLSMYSLFRWSGPSENV